MFWICFGYVLGMFWVCFRYVLGMFWVCFGYALDYKTNIKLLNLLYYYAIRVPCWDNISISIAFYMSGCESDDSPQP